MGAGAPRRIGEPAPQSEDEWLDWGTEGSIESEMGGMGGINNGNSTAAAEPIGDVVVPMLLMVAGYWAYKKIRTIFARRT